MAGDLNGHVVAKREQNERWHGGRTLGQRNEERKMILDMVRAKNLALVYAFLTISPEQTYTYKRSQNKTVIKYIAIRRDILGYIVNCKVIPSESVAPQHRMLVMDSKISKKRRIKRIRAKRMNWWKLKTEKGEELKQK